MVEQLELEFRILSELEEAGEENVPTIANTVFEPTGSPTELSQLQQALEKLIEADFVRVALSRDATLRLTDLSKNESLGVISNIRVHLVFKEASMHWTGGSQPWPEIVTTEIGKMRGRQILDERGYQWWRQKA